MSVRSGTKILFLSTSIKIAQACNIHGSLGQDLVAMCVNDVLAQGAEPLFFLDYFSCGKLDVGVASSVIRGIAEACQMAGCALLGERCCVFNITCTMYSSFQCRNIGVFFFQ